MKKHETDLEPRISNENLLEIQYQIGRAFRFISDKKAKIILKDKKAFQSLIQRISKDLEIPIQSENVLRQIPLLIDYFKKVFGLEMPELAELNFLEHQAFQTIMAVSPKHNEDEVFDAIAGYNKVNGYRYKTPIASNIDRNTEQKRPAVLYPFAHLGGDEPDQNHLGKSYDDAVASKMIFMNPKEYLLATGFHKFIKGYFMDKKGWTRTSSLWSGGYLVSGYWDDLNSWFKLVHGHRDNRDSDGGPRELIY